MCSNKSIDQTKKFYKTKTEIYSQANKKQHCEREKQHKTTQHRSTQQEQTANIKHDLFKCTQLFIGPGPVTNYRDWALEMSSVQFSLVELSRAKKSEEQCEIYALGQDPFVRSGKLQRLKALLLLLQLSSKK